MEVNKKLKELFKAGIKIFPVHDNRRRFAVSIQDPYKVVFKKKEIVGEFKHTTKTVNDALIQSLDFVYEKLTNKKTN